MKIFSRAVVLLALLVLGLDVYLLYEFYGGPDGGPAPPTARVAKVAGHDDGRSRMKESGYLARIDHIQAGSVDAFLDSNAKLLRYDMLTADDVEKLKANHVALTGYRKRADALIPPKKYEDQYESFDSALGDLNYATGLAHRLAADPISATQSEFDAYALRVGRAAEHLRRSNEILDREFETIEDARTPTLR